MNNNNIIPISVVVAITAILAALASVKVAAVTFPIVAAAVGYITAATVILMAAGDYRANGRSYSA
jgi:hypothetical protein